MRLIDEAALINEAETGSWDIDLKELKMILKYVETISDVPVVRGEWIAEQKGAEYCEFRCSECDHSVGQTDQFDETEVKQFSEWYNYCPNCGAKMVSGESLE